MSRFENAMTNVSKYSASGTTQSNGTAATSVERYVVTPRSKLDGTDASATQLASWRSDDDDRASERERHEHAITRGPDHALLGQPQVRLDQDRIAKKRDDAAEIARPVEKVRVFA
jgi:hypothetical protein